MTPRTFADVRVGQCFVLHEGGYPRVKMEGPTHLILSGYSFASSSNPAGDTPVYAVYKIDSLNLVEVK